MHELGLCHSRLYDRRKTSGRGIRGAKRQSGESFRVNNIPPWGGAGRTHTDTHINCQPGDEVGPALPACNPGNMELENIVANTVLLKAREGKT